MKRLNRVKIFALLGLVTLAVVFLPMTVNSLINSSRMDNEEAWHYDAPESKITARQVAELYYRGEIKSGMRFEYSEEESRLEAQKSMTLMAGKVFGDNEVREYIISLLEKSDIYYSRESVLITVDGLPVALNFFYCVLYAKGETVEVFYEEKTNTLMNFSYGRITSELENGEIPISWELSDLVAGYYGNISIDEDRYYYNVETDVDFDMLSFGISTEVPEEEMDKY